MIGRLSPLSIEIDLERNIKGRYLAKDTTLPDGTTFKRNHFVTIEDARTIDASGIPEVMMRTPMSCKTRTGICRKCYGADITTWEPIDLGEAVGTIAAQAIGEPGTQLTMNTKHKAGTASVEGDVAQGLPRVEEVFERRSPKGAAAVAHITGTITEIKDEGREKIVTIAPETGTKGSKKKDTEYTIVPPRKLTVKVGQTVEKGDLLTDGSADPAELFKYAGREKTQEYIIQETGKIYELQGVSIARKHIEVIVKQMFSRRKVKEIGDTHLNIGDVVESWYFDTVNDAAEEAGGLPATAERHLLGITEVSLSRQSFLSSASFQHTTKSLINASTRGARDELRGLKENVIIGRLIPAGTGYEGSKKFDLIRDLQSTYVEPAASVDEVPQYTPQDVAPTQ